MFRCYCNSLTKVPKAQNARIQAKSDRIQNGGRHSAPAGVHRCLRRRRSGVKRGVYTLREQTGRIFHPCVRLKQSKSAMKSGRFCHILAGCLAGCLNDKYPGEWLLYSLSVHERRVKIDSIRIVQPCASSSFRLRASGVMLNM